MNKTKQNNKNNKPRIEQNKTTKQKERETE